MLSSRAGEAPLNARPTLRRTRTPRIITPSSMIRPACTLVAHYEFALSGGLYMGVVV